MPQIEFVIVPVQYPSIDVAPEIDLTQTIVPGVTVPMPTLIFPVFKSSVAPGAVEPIPTFPCTINPLAGAAVMPAYPAPMA